jgi:hypothetical protein
MATKKVASKGTSTAASHDRNPTDVKRIPSPGNPILQGSAVAVPPHLQPKPAAKPLDQVKKATKSSPRKETLAAVKATSSKAQTENTIPYVLLRKATKPGAKATRSIVNFIIVGDTAEAHHVRPVRIAIVGGDAYGTNYSVPGSSVIGGVNDIRKARFFEYGRRLQHGKSAKTVSAWDIGNEQAIRALEKLGAISKYDLEFHLEEAKRRKAYNDASEQAKARTAKHKDELANLKALIKRVVKDQGSVAVRQAIRSIAPAVLVAQSTF